jgi:hypothetical protein
MELNISEISETKIPKLNKFKTINNYAKPNIESTNHSEKKKVTYDDIMNSLGMVVVDGKIQFYNKNSYQQQQQQPPQQKQQHNNSFSQNQGIQQKQLWKQPNPHVENVWQPPPPLSREQQLYIQRMNYIKRMQEIQRIRKIKSNKMFFTDPNGDVIFYK